MFQSKVFQSAKTPRLRKHAKGFRVFTSSPLHLFTCSPLPSFLSRPLMASWRLDSTVAIRSTIAAGKFPVLEEKFPIVGEKLSVLEEKRFFMGKPPVPCRTRPLRPLCPLWWSSGVHQFSTESGFFATLLRSCSKDAEKIARTFRDQPLLTAPLRSRLGLNGYCFYASGSGSQGEPVHRVADQ